MKKLNSIFWAAISLAMPMAFTACSNEPDNTTDNPSTEASKFAILVEVGSGDNQSQYILTTDDLMKDTVLSPANNHGIDVTGQFGAYTYFYRGKYYLSNDGTRFSQYEVTDDGKFKEDGNLAFGYAFYIGKVLETEGSDDEMVFTSTGGFADFAENVPGGRVERKPIYFLNTKTMSITKELEARIPYLDYKVYQDNGDVDSTTMHITSMEHRGDKMFFAYDFYNNKWGMVNDSTYIYVCDYPSMENGKVLKDGHGHTSSHWSYPRRAFFDADKNLYFITINSDDKQGLIRIKNNETEIDPDYFFDLSQYDIDGGIYGGAPVQELGKGLTYLKPYIIDAANKKVVVDLRSFTGQLEPSNSTQSFVEDGKLYDVFKTKDSRWFIYQYDPETNKATRGLELDGGVTWVDMVSKLK